MPNCTLNFFWVSITHLQSEGLKKNWITITAYFRNGKIPYTNLDRWWLTFWHNCNFRPKPGHCNSRVYCKQIDSVLKVPFNQRLPRLLWSNIPELWKLLKNQFCYFLEKKTIDIGSWSFLRHKTKVSTLQKVPKNTILSVMAR